MATMRSVDLNADLGEGFGPWRMGDDPALLAIVSSANIACGFHAGDPKRCMLLALRRRRVAWRSARIQDLTTRLALAAAACH